LGSANKWIGKDAGRAAKFSPVEESDPLTFSNSYYVADIDIGTPDQNFSVIMDTASSILWVPGTHCYCYRMTGTLYNPDNSSTCEEHNTTFTLAYRNHNAKEWGTCSGQLATDVVCIADICVNATFGIASYVSNSQYGYCGLAFATLTDLQVMSPVQNMIFNNMLDNPWFTLWLTSTHANDKEINGQLTLGDYDPQHCSDKCDWVSLTNAGYYQFEIDQIIVKGNFAASSVQAISDSTSRFIYGPSETISKIAAGFDAGPTPPYIINCGLRGHLPPIIIKINGIEYPVSSNAYIVKSDDYDNVCGLAFGPLGNETSGELWVLGQVWIREYCQVYDMKNKRIGICQNNYPPHKTTTTTATTRNIAHETTQTPSLPPPPPPTTSFSPPTVLVIPKMFIVFLTLFQFVRYYN
jgi:pepsin A